MMYPKIMTPLSIVLENQKGDKLHMSFDSSEEANDWLYRNWKGLSMFSVRDLKIIAKTVYLTEV